MNDLFNDFIASNTSNEVKEKSQHDVLNSSKRRQELLESYALKHIGHLNWDLIAGNNQLSDIFRQLYLEGDDNYDPNILESPKYLAFGDDIYTNIRPDMIKRGIVNDVKEKKTKKPNFNTKVVNPGGRQRGKLGKREMIIRNNILKKAKEEYQKIIEMTEFDEFQNIKITSKYTEFIMLQLMIYMRDFSTKIETSKKNIMKSKKSRFVDGEEVEQMENDHVKLEFNLFEIIIALTKLLEEITQIEGTSSICIDDFKNWLEKCKMCVNFDIMKVYEKYPEILFKNSYGHLFSNDKIGLYKSQCDIMDFVKNNESYFAIVHTMLGSGKTSMILPLCGMIKLDNTGKKIIYSCPNSIVLFEVANMIYGLGIPFAILVYNKEQNCIEYKFSSAAYGSTPTNLSKNVREEMAKNICKVFICDFFITNELLIERTDCIKNYNRYMKFHNDDPEQYPLDSNRVPKIPEYILILDELTMNADSQNGHGNVNFSVTTEMAIKILKNSPQQVIAMSATLPSYNDLRIVYDSIGNNNPNMVFKSFTSDEAKIGCNISTCNGESFVPHTNSKTCNELGMVLEIIKTDPFMGRLYTLTHMIELLNFAKENGINVPKISELYSSFNINQKKIQSVVYDILGEIIRLNSDELVEKMCKSQFFDNANLEMNTIFTPSYSKFSQGCLIFTSDPVEMAKMVYRNNFQQFVEDGDIFEAVKIENICKKYNRETEKRERDMKKMSKMKNTKSQGQEMSRLEMDKNMSNMANTHSTWEFPSVLQLGSIEHLKISKCDISKLSPEITPDDIPENLNTPNSILIMLYSGIGIYTTKNPALSDLYLNTVLLLAKQGKIKFIFSDSSLAYGVNLAVSDIIMIDDKIDNGNKIIESLLDQHSIKTILQMLGRAGRGGNLSYKADIHTYSDNLIKNFYDYIRKCYDDGDHDDIKNIRNTFNTIW